MMPRAKQCFKTQPSKPNGMEEGDLEDKINSSQGKILLLQCRKLPGTVITPHESLCPSERDPGSRDYSAWVLFAHLLGKSSDPSGSQNPLAM